MSEIEYEAKEGAAKSLSRAGCCLLSLVLSACSSVDSRTGPEPMQLRSAGVSESQPAYGNPEMASSRDAHAHRFSRSANLAAGMVGSMIKTYTTDPLVRPVSTAGSFGFLLKHSISDFSRRLYIDAVGLPAVTANPIPPLSGGTGMDLESWEHELDRITGSRSSFGSLEFLIDGEEFFPALIEQFEAARRSIQLRVYIFDNDDYAVRIADLLKKRAQEVDVTVLMDGLGSVTGAHVVPASMPESHVSPGSITSYLESGSRVKARQTTNPWFRGDHSKVAIIDRKVAFLGGMNIGREYRYDWHDLMVRIEGPVVERLARDADLAWAKSGLAGDLAGLISNSRSADETRTEDGYPVRLLYTRAGSSQIYQAKIAAIRRAREYIYMENPYFSDDVILYELIKARRRGVDVRFIISERGDMPLMDKSNVRTVNRMLANGIRVFVYPGMAHSKAALIDGWLTVGSANLDHLSLRVNDEVNVATSDPGAVNALRERLFEHDFEISTELQQPLPTQLSHWLAEVVADMFM